MDNKLIINPLISDNIENIKVTPLSVFNPDYDHTKYTNYAISQPFQLFTENSVLEFQKLVKQFYGTKYERHTKRTSACIRGVFLLEENVFRLKDQLESIASKLVGMPMRLQLRVDYSHINIQRDVQSNLIDDWHFDSTPFVLVTILTDHVQDPGANLIVSQNNKEITYKLEKPGQACLMQGNQVYHCAQQSLIGERMSMVTSFYIDSPLIYDCSSLKTPITYSDFNSCVDQYLNHFLIRLRKICKANVNKGDNRNNIVKCELDKFITDSNLLKNYVQCESNKVRMDKFFLLKKQFQLIKEQFNDESLIILGVISDIYLNKIRSAL